MGRRKPCGKVWLCATQNPADLCYRHYHGTCFLAAGHAGDCDTGSGPGHTSANRVGDIMDSVPAAYEAMRRIGWKG